MHCDTNFLISVGGEGVIITYAFIDDADISINQPDMDCDNFKILTNSVHKLTYVCTVDQTINLNNYFPNKDPRIPLTMRRPKVLPTDLMVLFIIASAND